MNKSSRRVNGRIERKQKPTMKLRDERPGIALIAALLLASFLLTLGILRVYLVRQDYFFASRAQLNQEAYYSAMSGVRYFMANDRLFQFETPITRAVPLGDPRHFFEVTLNRNYTLVSRGYVLDAARNKVAERTMIMPQVMYYKLYDTQQ